MNDDNKEGTFINCQTEICNELLPRVREVVYENLTSFKNPNAKYPNSPKCLKYQISFFMFPVFKISYLSCSKVPRNRWVKNRVC